MAGKEFSPGRTPPKLKKPPDRVKKKKSNLIASQRRAALDVYGDLPLSRSQPHNTSGGPERTAKRKIDTGRVPVKSNKKQKQQRKKQKDSFHDRDSHTPESDELRALAGPDDVQTLKLKLAKLEGKLAVSDKEVEHLKEQVFTYKSQAENWEDKWDKEREVSKSCDESLAKEIHARQQAELGQANMAGQIKQLERFTGPGEHSDSEEDEVNDEPNGRDSIDSNAGEGLLKESQELTPEKSRSSKPRKNVKLPTLQAWDSVSRNEEDSVLVFLPRLAQYLDASNVPKYERMDHVLPFLKGRAFMLWQLEADRMTHENEVPTWTHFEKFMKDSFGITAPERHARKKWDRLTQTGNVFKYVQETRSLVQQMKPMAMICPGEADIVHHFILNARPPLREWLTTHTPVGYWESSQQIFEKAIEFGTNQDPVLTRSVIVPRVLGAMASHPSHFRQHSRNYNSKRAAVPRKNSNKRWSVNRRSFGAASWPPLQALAPQGGAGPEGVNAVHIDKRSKGPDREGLRNLVNTHLTKIEFNPAEATRMACRKCPCCDKTGHVLANCTPELLVKFLTKKNINVPSSMIG
jgi:hypothetical protein